MQAIQLLILTLLFPLSVFSADISLSCSKFLGDCERIPEPLKLASEMCKAEQKLAGCENLAKTDPEVASSIRSCSPGAVCDSGLMRPIDQLKGCFSGAVEVGKDFWEALSSIPDLAGKGAANIRECWNSPECRSSTFESSMKNYSNAVMFSNPILAPLALWRMRQNGSLSDADLKKMSEVSLNLLEKGKQYLEKQGVKLACFNNEAQAEMLCYGVLSVVSPGKAVNVLAKAPKLAKLLQAGGLAAKETAVASKAGEAAVDFAKMAKLSNAERIAEAEKSLGRALTAEQKEALVKAHEIASETGRGYGTYSAADLKQKADILKAAGFSDVERNQLMRQGIAGMYGDSYKARVYFNQTRLEADKLRTSNKIEEATKKYKESADSYEVYLKDAKVQKSERDYLVGSGINAQAGRYDKAAEYFLESKSAIRNSSEKAEVIFESLRREKDELRVIAAKARTAGTEKAYKDHMEMIKALVNNPKVQLSDAIKRELLRP